MVASQSATPSSSPTCDIFFFFFLWKKPGTEKTGDFPGIQTPGISREYKPQEFPRNTNLRNFFGSYRAGKIPGTGDIQEFPRSGWVLLVAKWP